MTFTAQNLAQNYSLKPSFPSQPAASSRSLYSTEAVKGVCGADCLFALFNASVNNVLHSTCILHTTCCRNNFPSQFATKSLAGMNSVIFVTLSRLQSVWGTMGCRSATFTERELKTIVLFLLKGMGTHCFMEGCWS